MGRWTLRHIDEVLITKLENIINGAIRRSREESDSKTKPSLSYESFVESLDEQDPFTIAVIEILLKELADRRTRTTAEDKKLISRQTASSLHTLAIAPNFYEPPQVPYNRFRNRSTTNLNGPPGSLYTPADSDEDELNIGDGMGGIEGARIDSALYDVYNSGQTGSTRGYPPAPALSSTLRSDDSATVHRPYEGASIPGRQLPVPHSHLVPGHPRRWTSVFGSGSSAGPGNATSLVRRPTIYRPHVVRRLANPAASEFSEFSARRRSSQRQRENRDRVMQDGLDAARLELPGIQPPLSMSHDLPRASLFDPPSPPANGTRVPSPSPSTEGDDAQSGRTPRASQNHGLPRDSGEGGDNELWRWGRWEDTPRGEWQARASLRRGGVQPPETMLPPADSILPPSSDPLMRDFELPSLLRPEIDDGLWFIDDRTFSRRHPNPSSSSVPPQETPASLPTPRSVSPTEENVSAAPASSGAVQ